MRYLPHTDEEIAEMLAVVGRKSLDELFCSVPDGCRVEGAMDLPEPLDEWQSDRSCRAACRKRCRSTTAIGC